MLIKLLNSYQSIFLILIVKVLNAEAQDDLKINFRLIQNECTQEQGGNTHQITEVGNTLQIAASGAHYINYYKCAAGGETIIPYDKGTNNNETAGLQIVSPKIKLEKYMAGLWVCDFLTNLDTNLQNKVVFVYRNHSYIQRSCHFNVTFKDSKSNSSNPGSSESDPNLWIYITSGTLLLFTIIILIQTWIIIYCKVKAQRVTRIQSLSLSVRSSENQDEKRYSTTPSRKNRITQLFGKNQKDETCIYETLEEAHGGYPPTPPIETIPTLKRNPSALDIRKRPPVPLPKEVSDDEVTDTLRHIQRQTLKNKEETKPKILPPLPESAMVPEPVTRSRTPVSKRSKIAPELKAKPTKNHPLLAEEEPEIPMTPGLTRSLQKKQGPSVVASELDNIFKRRQNTHQSQPTPSSPVKLPATNKSDNKPNQKFGKSGSFSSNFNPFANARKDKRSLPDIKPQRIDTEDETPELQKNIALPRSQNPNTVRPAPKRPAPAKIEPPNTGSLKKKPMPPVPAPNASSKPPVSSIPVEPPPQAMRLPLPQLPMHPQAPPGQGPRHRHLADVQESVYEEYDEEEPVYYNSDEEWTYEPLRKYNIYSA